jgi:hypothetical protein
VTGLLRSQTDRNKISEISHQQPFPPIYPHKRGGSREKRSIPSIRWLHDPIKFLSSRFKPAPSHPIPAQHTPHRFKPTNRKNIAGPSRGGRDATHRANRFCRDRPPTRCPSPLPTCSAVRAREMGRKVWSAQQGRGGDREERNGRRKERLREGKAVRAPFFYAEQGGRGPSVALTPVTCGKGVGSSNGGGRGQSADMWLRHHRMSVSVPYSRRFRPTVGEKFFLCDGSVPASGRWVGGEGNLAVKV